MPNLPVTPQSIRAALARIRSEVRETPVIHLPKGVLAPENPVSLKLELFQHAGSFKPRGVFNTLLGAQVPVSGVAAASGGNHGAAVAYGAMRLGLKARIFVPTISSPAKVATIRRFGAEVIQQGERYADALALCDAYQQDSGAMGIHAYDAWPTIEGQGTVAAEWEMQCGLPDTLLVASGGGGLVSGVATYAKGRARVFAIEPEGSRALDAALVAGGPVDVPVESIAADSLGARNVGPRVHAACADALNGVILVPDDAIRAAMRLLWQEFRIITEPGGAAALAALISGRYAPEPGEHIGVLVCGGNIELTKFMELVG